MVKRQTLSWRLLNIFTQRRCIPWWTPLIRTQNRAQLRPKASQYGKVCRSSWEGECWMDICSTCNANHSKNCCWYAFGEDPAGWLTSKNWIKCHLRAKSNLFIIKCWFVFSPFFCSTFLIADCKNGSVSKKKEKENWETKSRFSNYTRINKRKCQ